MNLFNKIFNYFKGPAPPKRNVFYYTAVVLYPPDRYKLFNVYGQYVPSGWTAIGDHMTINTGKADEGPATSMLGRKMVELKVTHIAQDDKIVALKVETDVPSKNENKHITLALNPVGGSAKHSNELSNWTPLERQIVVRGTVMEVEKKSPQQEAKPKDTRPQSAPAPNDPWEFVKKLAGKPDYVIRAALRGKFPYASDQEIESWIKSTGG